jgi:ubiquinone/menaquinone biosynthesis C-methylase UbiE
MQQETFADMMRAAGFQAVTYDNMTAGVVALHSGFKF